MPDTKMEYEDPQEQPKRRGRSPGQQTRPADQVAIQALSKSVSRLLWYTAQNPNEALGVRLARCAKAGVDRARAEKGLLLVEDAVKMARTQFEAAYAAPQKEPGVSAQRPTISL